jgi:IS5 family transposase
VRQAEADFTELIRRTGVEGRISSLKRDYGWRRTDLTTISGARTWCGHGILAHNLTKIARLTT